MADTPMVPLAVVTDLIDAIREALDVPYIDRRATGAEYERLHRARYNLFADRAVIVRDLLDLDRLEGAEPLAVAARVMRKAVATSPATYPVDEPSEASETR